MQTRLLLVFVGVLGLASCRFNPNIQDQGTKEIQGEWEEVPRAYRDQLLQYTSHQFRFSCDSFYVRLNTTAKNNTYPDSCYNKGTWTEYAKGTYRQSKDTLYLSGTFTKANWKQKISGCYRIGQYLNVLVIKKQQGDTLVLSNLTSHVPLHLHLSKRSTCQPKSLN